MNVDSRCVFCFVRSFEKMIESSRFSEDEKKIVLKKFFTLVANLDYEKPTPVIARHIHALFREVLDDPDPYSGVKKEFNDFMLGVYPELKKRVEDSSDPFETALRIAIGGNIIDFGPDHRFDVMETFDHVLNSDFAIDDSLALKKDIQNAETILYLGDNCGEIVADRIFLETIGRPDIYFAVRGNPVLNDATEEDAAYVGIDSMVRVVSNGYDAPSTIFEESSAEFREIFKRADCIIAKGQGNFEGLSEHKERRIYYLMMLKCEVVAERLGVKKGDFVVARNTN